MKVLVIGIDGADPDYLEEGMRQGKLPTFKKLIEDGVYVRLKSTIPPLSLPSWPSIYTGKNPGKTGIYNFVQMQDGSYETEVVDWKIPNTIWSILSQKGKKVAMVNNYFTYPPDEVNGIMIAATDNIEKGCYYPPQLEKEIEEKLGKLDFGIIPPYYAIPKKQLTALTDEMLKSSVRLVRYLMKHKQWDFFMTTLDVDRLHHLITDEKEIIAWYGKIDALIAEIIAEAKDAQILLISDHGGGKTKKEFYVNEFLREKGFLTLKQKYKSRRSTMLIRMGISMENLLKIIQVTKLDRILIKVLPDKVWDFAKTKVPRKDVQFQEAEIDWLKTKAFSPYTSTGAIQVNLAGREPYGIVRKEDYEKTVREIRQAFQTLELDGKKVKAETFAKDEIYHGEFIDKAPDITYIIGDWHFFPKISFSDALFKDPRDPGHHRTHGIFIAAGSAIQKKQIKQADVTDIVPTILKLFGIKPPKDIDGKSLL